jgi:hypothetical protein
LSLPEQTETTVSNSQPTPLALLTQQLRKLTLRRRLLVLSGTSITQTTYRSAEQTPILSSWSGSLQTTKYAFLDYVLGRLII